MNKKIIVGIVALVMCTILLSTTAISAGLLKIDRSYLADKKESFTTIKTIKSFDRSRWVYFSLPFEGVIPKDKLRIQVGSELLTFNQAVNEGIVEHTIFVFNDELQRWDIADELETGKGYLIYVYTVKQDIVLKAAGNFKPGQNSIMLSKGWNYFGIPVSKPISLSKVLVDGNTIMEAAKKGIVEYAIFHFNEEKGYYVYLNHEKDSLQPGEVYCIYSYLDNVELSFF